jgi:hypothetical protein
MVTVANEDCDLWRFDQVVAEDPDRAARLRNAPPWEEVVDMIRSALRASVLESATRFGFDESGRNSHHLRAVLQFGVGKQLFDWFFNGHTGYRAQFRVGRENGAVANALIVTALRNELQACIGDKVSARRLTSSFDDLGPMAATSQNVLVSLDPILSKVWACDRLIGSEGGVTDLYVSRSGPKLLFDEGRDPWSSLHADEANAWFDVKGAFICDEGLYQLKDPALRAQRLQERGTA